MDAAIDTAALAAWMDRNALGRGSIEGIERLSGGTQNILLRFERSGRSYVLRHPPEYPRPNSNDTMRREARILAALADSDVPHPRLIAACGDDSVLGAAFYLMEPVEGFNPTGGLPSLHADSAVQHRMGLALVEAIAALGELDYRALGLADFGRAENYLERQVSRWKSQLDSYAEFTEWPGPACLPDVGRIAGWLDANRPGEFRAGIIHGDYHLANVMYRFDGPELAAIVDWELSTLGDPLLDLGWILATWPEPGASEGTVSVRPWRGFPTAEELVARYTACSSRDLSAIGWYAVLACYKLGILLEGTHARACAGKAPREVGARLHDRSVRLFGRAAGWIM